MIGLQTGFDVALGRGGHTGGFARGDLHHQRLKLLPARENSPLQVYVQRLEARHQCVADPQARPNEALLALVLTCALTCAVLVVDAIHLKVRDGRVTNRPFYVVIGVTVDGRRDILGI